MSEPMEDIKKWAEEMAEYEPVSWDRLPQIYLYMDQVITYMEGHLKPFESEDGTKLLTSSMINNYVKDGVLPRPEQKKYSPYHLAILTVICMLKPVLSIPNISYMINQQIHRYNKGRLYNMFCKTQADALREVCERVEAMSDRSENEMIRLAVELSMEANARRIAAEKIVNEFSSRKKEKDEAAQKPEA
jgi:hypothetical protein